MDFINPMKPISSSTAPEGDEYIYQIKWDGIRCLAYIFDEELKLYTKSGRERADYYPELSVLPQLISKDKTILDGELVVFNKEMKPTFSLILHRDRIKDRRLIDSYAEKYPAYYIVFDILMYDGQDLRDFPLIERQRILDMAIKSSRNVMVAENYNNGDELLSLMKDKGFEGIISKLSTGRYISGKGHNDWIKTKIYKKLLAIVCGVNMKSTGIKSLILGINSGDTMRYIGSASLGLKQRDLDLLSSHMDALRCDFSIFSDLEPKDDSIVWFKPLLTCWVSFLEWTDKGIIRHPRLAGFTDKPPRDANGDEYTFYG